MIYLDNAATSIVDPLILDTYVDLNKNFYGNAASNHQYGLASNKLLQASREQILKLFNLGDDYEVIFNSGATESNNEAIKGIALKYQNRGKHLITSKGEHPSVLESFKQLEEEFGFTVTYLNIGSDGTISIDELKSALREDTILVSLMAVNNEVGSVNDLKSIRNILKNYPKVFFHCDTTQAIGKIPLDYRDLDLFVLSAHKINGLKGSGALIKKKILIFFQFYRVEVKKMVFAVELATFQAT